MCVTSFRKVMTMDLYKGYVPTKNKQCTMPFKGKSSKELMTLDQVKDLPEYAGILNDDTIMIDVDDLDQAEILMDIVEDLQIDCRVLQTSRGKHFLFKNKGVDQCYTHCKTAIGLTVDIKIGTRNQYEVLKTNGEERFIEWDYNIGDLPVWLLPVKTDIDLLNMEDGDGRNSALFGYELVLQSAGLTKEETKDTIRLINKHVLKDPLSDRELETILRDEAFAKPVFFKGKTFLHNVFGDYLIREMHIKRIKGYLHVYRDGIYTSGSRYIENSMQKLYPSMTARQRTEVLKYLDIMNPDDNDIESDANLIPFKNGVLNINTMEILPFSPDYIITNKIPWNYNPDAYSELADKTLDQWSCSDPEIRSLLEECIGYCFYRKNNLEKAFILTGSGANGKSTYLEVLKKILSTQNYSPLDLCEVGERFSTIMLSEKLANIGDDINMDFLEGKTLSLFKKIVSGNAIKAEGKNDPAKTMIPIAKLLFSANSVPKMATQGIRAIKRRLIIIPFNATFERYLEDGSDNPEFNNKLKEELTTQESIEYLIVLGIKGLKRILENADFSKSAKVQDEVDQFEKDNDPILQWLDTMKNSDESDVVKEYICRETLTTIYASYSTFCYEHHLVPMSDAMLSKELLKRFNLKPYRKTTEGVKYTMYKKPM